MARDVEALKIQPFADGGDRLDPELRSPAIDRARGWTYDYSAVEGEVLRRDVFNQLLREITGMLHELNVGGSIPEFNPARLYKRGDIARGTLAAQTGPARLVRPALCVCHTDMTHHHDIMYYDNWREY